MPRDQTMLGPKLPCCAHTSLFLHLATLAGALLIASNTRAQAPAPALALMQDRYRPLLIFASEGDTRLPQQVETLRLHRADLIDRQIKLVPFFHAYAGALDTEIITFLPSEEPLLRKRFHISDKDFSVILVGKDGSEKLRSSKPLSFDQLRDAVDAMPMRQQETRRRASPGLQP